MLPGEDMLIKEELYLLVGDVDAQLLERIFGKILKPENIQDADG